MEVASDRSPQGDLWTKAKDMSTLLRKHSISLLTCGIYMVLVILALMVSAGLL